MSELWPEQYGLFFCETCDWFHEPDSMKCPVNACYAIRGLIALWLGAP